MKLPVKKMQVTQAPQIIRTYKANAIYKQKFDEKMLAGQGYRIVSREEDIKQRSGLKTIGLGLIFLPLALFGTNRMVKITYQKEEGVK